MGTLTIRKVDDGTIADLKAKAKANNRSTEAEVRSLLEDYTAQLAAQRIMSNSDLVRQMWDLLGDTELDADENLTPPRESYDADVRPVTSTP